MSQVVRTRIAPSPTGDPHVGTAYVALFNYAFAKQHGGQFLLRIEDTDRVRSHPASEQMIFDALHWLGLHWDEGPDVGGAKGPYRQSERSEMYREHVEMLIDKGHAYPCFCTKERLDQLRTEQKEKKLPLGYDGHCRHLDPQEAKKRRNQGETHVVRLAMPKEGQSHVHDLLRGEIVFENAGVDDQVLLKSDGYPTYHLANVVDDHLMEITHVIRAEEWISSLPKHVFLYQAFGWDCPVFCHLPLLRNADKSKISKRKNPVSLNYYKKAGFMPEAMVNYLALMGWSMPDEKEEFSLQEFIDVFKLEDITLGGPVFDLSKLTWLNGKHMRSLSASALQKRIVEVVLNDEYLEKIIPLIHERIDKLEDFIDYASFFFTGSLVYDANAQKRLVAKKKTAKETAKILKSLVEDTLDALLVWNEEVIEEALREFCESSGWSPRELFMPIRIAVTGKAASPGLFETMAVLGKELCRRRIREASELLKTM